MESNVLLGFFEKICAIPHGSFNEGGIADYLCEFAEERKLFWYRDTLNNVFIRKKASDGMEDAPSVLLQGHTDMVCEKNSGTVHDFEKDGIKVIIDGDSIRADGTTLGADDGAAVAMMLAVLDDKSMSLPEIECLFTVCEEVGLQGASGFDCSFINSRIMINIDSGTENEVTVSCAGGVKSRMLIPFDDTHSYDDTKSAVSVFVSGLAGGHSGIDIHLNRGNANKIASRLLLKIVDNYNVCLSSINGGNKDNAIPRECSFTVGADKSDIESIKDIIETEAENIRKNLTSADAGFNVCVKNVSEKVSVSSVEKTKLIAELLNATPDGVISMNKTIHGMVETSVNTGVIRTEENTVKITYAPRSSSEAQLDDIIRKLDSFAYSAGGTISHDSRYPGWESAETSVICEKYVQEFEKLNGHKPKIISIHAGLECGLIKSKIPDMDIISIGPDMEGIHTPSESMSLSSMNRIYSILCSVLQTI